jgi:thousand and one amino acid protein kinase
MPAATRLKLGNIKDPAVAQLFSTKDPETRYCDLREVGSGSFGNVYYVCLFFIPFSTFKSLVFVYKQIELKAQDKESNETVAIKKMHFSGKDALEKWNDIIKEVRFLKNVKHPNIVEYRGCFLKDQTCWVCQHLSQLFILMEL